MPGELRAQMTTGQSQLGGKNISQSNLKTSHWEATEYTVAKTILEALLYCRDELLRHVTTLNNVLQTASRPPRNPRP